MCSFCYQCTRVPVMKGWMREPGWHRERECFNTDTAHTLSMISQACYLDKVTEHTQVARLIRQPIIATASQSRSVTIQKTDASRVSDLGHSPGQQVSLTGRY